MIKEESMGRFRSSGLWLAIAVCSLLALPACGKGSKSNTPLFPGKVTITPGNTTSVQLGGTLIFTAAVQTVSGTNISTPVTYTSSDTSILNLAPNGIACGGHWDVAFTTCTPGTTGVALVTASALGGNSEPTYVFVHPPIDNVTVSGVLLTGVPIQEPCLSQSQTMTVEAHAFSRGTDITASVGPFTWSASNAAVVTLTPLPNTAVNPLTNTTYNFPTNQATATAVTPGIAYIYASAGGATNASFQQPTLTNASGGTSPVLDFFATCAIENIALEVGNAGSGQTNLVAAKGGTTQSIFATLTDIMGNSSLPNTDAGIVLSKIPLTWSVSQPGAVGVATGCTQSCAVSLTSPGAGTITASCSPPTCNVGFPLVPATLATPAQISACSSYFQAIYPIFAGCQLLIPVPVYSSNEFIIPTAVPPVAIELSPAAAISAQITGSTSTANVFASSFGCAHVSPADCSTSSYYLITAKASAGSENTIPVSPNSFLFDPTGAKLYMGSDFGAETVNPTNFGSSTSPFGGLGTVTGKVLAVSSNGNSAIFSDTIHTPNQVYVVQTSPTSLTTALNISSGTTAAFSPDGLKAFIVGGANSSSLYVYSPLQALQQYVPTTTPPTNPQLNLLGPADDIKFSPNGAFAYVAESAANGGSANITAFANCNNQLAATINIPANPILMRVLPNFHLDGTDSSGLPIPDGVHLLVLDATGFDIVTSTITSPLAGTVCPQVLAISALQRIELGQQINSSANFFASPDGTQLYVVNPGSSSILIYSFIAGAPTGGIEILGNATPLGSDISADGGTIVIVGSDGLLHEIGTATGGADLYQVPFPNLPNYLNPFCTFTPSAGPCTFNVALVKP